MLELTLGDSVPEEDDPLRIEVRLPLDVLAVVGDEDEADRRILGCQFDICMGIDVRVSGLCEHLLTQVAATPALDAVQVVVDPNVPIPVSTSANESHGNTTYSSAPSMVTSISGYWSTSPKSS